MKDVGVVITVLTVLAVGVVDVVGATVLSVTHSRSGVFSVNEHVALVIYRHIVNAGYVHLVPNSSLCCVKIV